mgnify:CR=1 FL=1
MIEAKITNKGGNCYFNNDQGQSCISTIEHDSDSVLITATLEGSDPDHPQELCSISFPIDFNLVNELKAFIEVLDIYAQKKISENIMEHIDRQTWDEDEELYNG